MLKIYLKNLSLLYFYLLFCGPVSAQFANIQLKNEFSLSSIDTQGNLFVADSKGNIYKYDILGMQLSVYSPTRKSKAVLLNAELSMKIWVFYEDIQHLVILDRQLRPIDTRDFSTNSSFISLITADYDNHVWWIDNSDFSLKKQNLINNQIINTTPLNQILKSEQYQFGYIRYYQNRLYISNLNQSLLVFDNLGNLVKEWPLTGIDKFSFHQNEIFFVREGQVTFMNLESGAMRTEEVAKDILWIEINPQTRFVISEKTIKLYKK